MIEENEYNEQDLSKLIDIVEKDPIPTNIFTTEDDDPLVLLGKMNEIEEHLKGIRDYSVETKNLANSVEEKATNAVNTSNNAINTANVAKDIANNTMDIAIDAHSIAQDALTQSNEAISTADTANTKADNAVTTADTAKTISENALEQVTEGLGTKVYDVNGNLMNSAKLTGHNGINVDMSENDPNTFDVRLDKSITDKITEHTNMLSDIDSDIAELTNITTEQAGQIKDAQNTATSADTVATSAYNLANETSKTVLEHSKKLAKALFTPQAIPTEQLIVGVNTNNAQNMIKLGKNLVIENDKIDVKNINDIKDNYVSTYPSNYKDIPNNSDLNDEKWFIKGTYVITSNASVATLTNCPVDIAFRMIVVHITGDGDPSLRQPWCYGYRRLELMWGGILIQYFNTDGNGDLNIEKWQEIVFKDQLKQLRFTPVWSGALFGGNSVNIGTDEADMLIIKGYMAGEEFTFTCAMLMPTNESTFRTSACINFIDGDRGWMFFEYNRTTGIFTLERAGLNIDVDRNNNSEYRVTNIWRFWLRDEN